uniref:helix-turn-helix transcriptional regulator n=1 Tax=Sulfobacillus thermotolerans TaxID=338644 RepID=UPI00155DC24E|nr:LuxR C-terminal-related transcriptional regulator [Sulfobacillus thermotolerans]
MLAGYGGITLTLTAIWVRRPAVRFVLQGSLWFVDVLMAELLLVAFARPNTGAPALLPVLAYEAELYWPRRGGMMGGLSAVGLLVSAGWLRTWAHRPFLSVSALCFWIGVLGVLIILPQLVTRATREDDAPHGKLRGFANAPTEELSLETADRPDYVPSITQQLPALSPREKEVCTLLCRGVSPEAIAAQLYIDIGTVKSHTARIYHKWGVHSRTELQQVWVATGLDSIETSDVTSL